MAIKSTEMLFYTDDGNCFSIELSAMQMALTCKLLGIQFKADSTITCFADNSLKDIAEMKGNPLALKKMD